MQAFFYFYNFPFILASPDQIGRQLLAQYPTAGIQVNTPDRIILFLTSILLEYYLRKNAGAIPCLLINFKNVNMVNSM